MAVRTDVPLGLTGDVDPTGVGAVGVFAKRPRAADVGGRGIKSNPPVAPTSLLLAGPFQKVAKLPRAVKMAVGSASNSDGGTSRPRGSYYWGL